MAPRLFGKAIDHGQAKAGALAHVLGRKERLEHLFQGFRIHARAGIGHRQHQIFAGPYVPMRPCIFITQREFAGLDRQFAALSHRIPGIESQI